MLDQIVKSEYLREQMLAGPIGPYLDVPASRLLQLGYSRTQSHKIVRTASLLGIWLSERGLTPADAGKPELLEYMATHRRTPKGRLSDGAVGFSRLPPLLAPEGVLCKPNAPAPGRRVLSAFAAASDQCSELHLPAGTVAVPCPPGGYATDHLGV